MSRDTAGLGIVCVALGVALGCGRPGAPVSRAPAPVAADGGVRARPAGADVGRRAAAPGADGGVAAPAPDSRPATVRILVRSAGPRMTVSWGRKHLGVTPLTVRRPRDSGPMDLVLRAGGYFPVHVRAYSYKDDTVVARPTKSNRGR